MAEEDSGLLVIFFVVAPETPSSKQLFLHQVGSLHQG